MHREPLLELLQQYDALWPQERAVTQRIQSLVSQHADCFDRTCRPGHVTASAWVTDAQAEYCLLVRHKKLDKWLQPGGHADGQSDVAGVARREVIEETGVSRLRLVDAVPLDLDVHPIPERRAQSGELIEDAHDHHDIRFLFVADPSDPLVLSDESHEVRWCNEHELRQRTDEVSVIRLREKALRVLRHAGV